MALVVKLVISLVFVGAANAAEISGVQFADKIDIGGQKLVLNGTGLAPSRQHGETYVAGLYLQSKSTDAANIITNPQAKIIRMTFLRAMDKKAVQKMWESAYHRACEKDCATAQPNLKSFNDLMVAVDAKETLQLSFDEDGVTFNFESSPEPHSGHISNRAFQKILLSTFLVHAKTASLSRGLLGLPSASASTPSNTSSKE